MAMKSLVAPTVTMPLAPEHYGTDKYEYSDKLTYERKVTEVLDMEEEIELQVENLYFLVLGQCTEALKARDEAHPDFSMVSDVLNGVTLLSIIKAICFNFQEQKFIAQSVIETTCRFYSTKQHKNETVTHYYERYQNQLAVLEQCGGSVGADYGIQKLFFEEKGINPATASPEEYKMVLAATREQILAMGFLLGADPERYGAMTCDYESAFTAGQNEWPRTLLASYRALNSNH